MNQEIVHPRFTAVAIGLLGAVVGLTTGISAFAGDDLVLVESTSKQNPTELVLNFETPEAVQGVCPLIVNRFEYFAPLKSVIVDAQKETPCLNDGFGKLKGQFAWMLPTRLLQKEGSLQIQLNGKLAGTAQIHGRQVTIVPQTKPAQARNSQ